jgi:hypothetical protein
METNCAKAITLWMAEPAAQVSDREKPPHPNILGTNRNSAGSIPLLSLHPLDNESNPAFPLRRGYGLLVEV